MSTCQSADCARQRGSSRGLCVMHYKRQIKLEKNGIEFSQPRPCSTAGCEGIAKGRSLMCRPCYLTDWKAKQADAPPKPDWKRRLFSKFTLGEDCWEWRGAKTGGYGMFGVGGSRGVQPAYRVVYELFVGPIPPGLQLDHLCRNRGCVNPLHLEPVTASENTRRARAAAKERRR